MNLGCNCFAALVKFCLLFKLFQFIIQLILDAEPLFTQKLAFVINTAAYTSQATFVRYKNSQQQHNSHIKSKNCTLQSLYYHNWVKYNKPLHNGAKHAAETLDLYDRSCTLKLSCSFFIISIISWNLSNNFCFFNSSQQKL